METFDPNIPDLGPRKIQSPLIGENIRFVSDDERVLYFDNLNEIVKQLKRDEKPMTFEIAGARREIFFKPQEVVACIVTCGGLCPGLNDVIRSITMALFHEYGVKKVYGALYGYQGLSSKYDHSLLKLTPELVDDINNRGGTILSTSRGPQKASDIVDTLVRRGINILFTIGGDGTQRGAHEIADEIERRKLKISVIGIPKTIDNDIPFVRQTFGFSTAVESSRSAILTAHEEAKSEWNCVGIVKLMGRDSGFIAASATTANPVVNYCMVPEAPFELYGEKGFLKTLEKRLERKRHAVIVVAEGAGQEWIEGEQTKDASGNILKKDIGLFLKTEIEAHFKKIATPVKIKYIDPSYIIRAAPANSLDSTLCLTWGNAAVHAAMAGKTNMLVGWWNWSPTHVPLHMATSKRRKIDLQAHLWQSVLTTTEPLVPCS